MAMNLNVVVRRTCKSAGRLVLILALFATAWPLLSNAASSGAATIYCYLVFNEPIAGREAEYNEWYDHTHVAEVVANNGVVSGQRYVATELDPRSKPLRKYLTIYQIKSTDLATTFQGFKHSSGTPQSQPIDPSSAINYVYQPLGPEIKGAGPKAFGKGEMKTYAMFIRNGPFAGQDAEYNVWYNTTHAPDFSSTPGVISGQRFIFSEVQRNQDVMPPPTQYLAMYTVVTDDFTAFLAALDERAKRFVVSKAFDPKTSLHFTYQAIGPQLHKSAAQMAAEKQP